MLDGALATDKKSYLKADLHCHSYFSGKTNHVRALEPMDCYSSPEQIYRLAKARGMDVVTITDHDSIDGCLHFLNCYPEKHGTDFIIGEEVTAFLPEFGNRVHIGVYDITEEQHREISRLKHDFDDLVLYLRSEGIIHVLNHLFHGFPRRNDGRKFIEKMMNSFDLFEGLNGAIGRCQNGLVARMVRRYPNKSIVAGSDSHTLLRLGSCYTLAEGKTKSEFLHSLRAGRVSIAGPYGRFTHIFNDAMGVYLSYFRDIAFRNEVHRDWSALKKIRNGMGWAGYLPVFLALSFVYSVVYYRLEDRKQPYYEGLYHDLADSPPNFNLNFEGRKTPALSTWMDDKAG
jgi:predicted metal-dependent phosphoesterase TrpH